MSPAELSELIRTFLSIVGFFALIHILVTEVSQEFKGFIESKESKEVFPTPRAKSLTDIQFIFDRESMIITDMEISKVASMHKGATFEIPHGAIFEVRANEKNESFSMIIQSSEKNKGFRTCAQYQKSSVSEPKYMCGWDYVSIKVEKENPVKMCLRAGLRYQKMIGAIKLVDAEGNPFIETLEHDIEAYLIGNTCKAKKESE